MEYKFATREELSVEETVLAVISELEESWIYKLIDHEIEKVK